MLPDLLVAYLDFTLCVNINQIKDTVPKRSGGGKIFSKISV